MSYDWRQWLEKFGFSKTKIFRENYTCHYRGNDSHSVFVIPTDNMVLTNTTLFWKYNIRNWVHTCYLPPNKWQKEDLPWFNHFKKIVTSYHENSHSPWRFLPFNLQALEAGRKDKIIVALITAQDCTQWIRTQTLQANGYVPVTESILSVSHEIGITSSGNGVGQAELSMKYISNLSEIRFWTLHIWSEERSLPIDERGLVT